MKSLVKPIIPYSNKQALADNLNHQIRRMKQLRNSGDVELKLKHSGFFQPTGDMEINKYCKDKQKQHLQDVERRNIKRGNH